MYVNYSADREKLRCEVDMVKTSNQKVIDLSITKNKPIVKKRNLVITGVLSALVAFGGLKEDKSTISLTPYSHGKVIPNQKLKSFNNNNDSNSGTIIETGNGTILKIQKDNSSRNSKNINEIILIKDHGIIPGADAFSNNQKPHRPPRMKGQQFTVDPPRTIKGLKDLPSAPKVRSFTESQTTLHARRHNRDDKCPTPQFNIKKEYETFIEKMSEKGYKLECSLERFSDLSTNPQTGNIDAKSLIEAKGGLQGEAQGMFNNIRRPSNKNVDLDFEIDSSQGYTHVDYKTPIDFKDLADNKGVDVSNFPTLESVAYNMGHKIPGQKTEFCGIEGGPESPNNVLHVVNLDLIRDSDQKQAMMDKVLKGVEDLGCSIDGVYFLNYL